MAALLGRCSPADVASAARACGGAVALPDAAGAMRPASDLVVDDAPWLKAALAAGSALLFVHPCVPVAAAAALGVGSLRDKLLSAQAEQAAVPCPAPAALRSHVTSSLFGADAAAAGASANAVAAASGGARGTLPASATPPGVTGAAAAAAAAAAATAAACTVRGGPMGAAAVARCGKSPFRDSLRSFSSLCIFFSHSRKHANAMSPMLTAEAPPLNIVHPFRCVLDLVAMADALLPNCSSLRVCFDERSFGTESLLHPVCVCT